MRGVEPLRLHVGSPLPESRARGGQLSPGAARMDFARRASARREDPRFS